MPYEPPEPVPHVPVGRSVTGSQVFACRDYCATEVDRRLSAAHLLIGHAPVLVAVLLSLGLAVVIVPLVRAIRRQDQRERSQRSRRLDNHELRLRDLEDHLGLYDDEPRTRPPEEDQWPNSASNQ